jgi:hypothetical protein
MADDPRLVALVTALRPVVKGVVAGNSLNAVLHGLTVPQYAAITFAALALEHDMYLFFCANPEVARMIDDYLTFPPNVNVHPAVAAVRAFFDLCTR